MLCIYVCKSTVMHRVKTIGLHTPTHLHTPHTFTHLNIYLLYSNKHTFYLVFLLDMKTCNSFLCQALTSPRPQFSCMQHVHQLKQATHAIFSSYTHNNQTLNNTHRHTHPHTHTHPPHTHTHKPTPPHTPISSYIPVRH